MTDINPKEYLKQTEFDIAREIDVINKRLGKVPCTGCETSVLILIKEVALLRMGLDKMMNDIYHKETPTGLELN